jgi:hypothetical protein
MSTLFLLAAFVIGAVLGSLVTLRIERWPRKLSPEALERINRIYAEAAAIKVEPEFVLPKTSDLSFAEWQQEERRRMAEEKARGVPVED